MPAWDRFRLVPFPASVGPALRQGVVSRMERRHLEVALAVLVALLVELATCLGLFIATQTTRRSHISWPSLFAPSFLSFGDRPGDERGDRLEAIRQAGAGGDGVRGTTAS